MFRYYGEWQRKDVVLEQTWYTPRQVEYHLKRAGFLSVEAQDRPLNSDQTIADFAGRTFFLARCR